jgi:hypothetical protein
MSITKESGQVGKKPPADRPTKSEPRPAPERPVHAPTPGGGSKTNSTGVRGENPGKE